ncbi:MAG: hypothetical protein JNK67_13770 [Alphaproteobacteria bacterium]|nr:hypothetical protein [Alphaproteobacteria bacterium]
MASTARSLQRVGIRRKMRLRYFWDLVEGGRIRCRRAAIGVRAADILQFFNLLDGINWELSGLLTIFGAKTRVPNASSVTPDPLVLTVASVSS